MHSPACPAAEDVRMWRNLVALLPYTVHVNREAEWAELIRRDAHQRAEALLRIPAPRVTVDPLHAVRVVSRRRPVS